MICRVRFYLSVILVIVIPAFFLSCSSARIRSMQLTARESSPPMFVQNKNMEIIPIADNSSLKNINKDSIVALQNELNFIRVENKEHYVRLIKGPMNLYYLYTPYTTTSFHGPSAANPSGVSIDRRLRLTRYFDLGLDQPLILFNRENIEEYTSECKLCLSELEKFDRNLSALKWWKYTNWAALAGALTIGLTSDNNASDDSDFRIYGFTGLFFGGLTSEIFRLTRVNRNEIRFEEVVNKFNAIKY